ncbi:ELWxxDGT repeat protein, partial [Acaryochloris sp. IP29b_bin.148]|uniref:ELWxxDGT repeat protein n=1 Tax=Acaryochloris sp. IP29b_bin.148 TaxID=2969218 RepID=UPI00260C9137
MEPNDTLLTATPTNIDAGEKGEFTFNGEIGDNPDVDTSGDVDLYTLELSAGTGVTFDLNTNNSDSFFDSILRVFDAEGNELAVNDDAGNGSFIGFLPPADGTYYVGVSGFSNFEYDPEVAGSGSSNNSTGSYELIVTTSDFEAGGFIGAAQLLKDIRPGNSPYGYGGDYPASSNASDFTEFNGQLFFTANDGTTGNELWVTDGTAEGTQLLKDIRPGEGPYGSSSNASDFTEFNGQLF